MKNKIVIILGILLLVFFFVPSVYFMTSPETTAIDFFKSYWWTYLITLILIITLQSMRKPPYLIKIGESGRGRTYGKKYFDEKRKARETKEALKYAQGKLYTLVNTPHGVRDDLKKDAWKALNKCNEILGEI